MDELTIEILNKERQRYVDYFVETTDRLKKVKDTFASELLIRINDQTIPEPFDLTRVDLIYKNEKDETIINELRLDLDTEGLKTWIWKWLKVDDETNGQISEAIHNCTVPETTGDKNKFTVDLGTSPQTTLIELIDSLTKTGTKEISIETSVV